MRCAHEIEKIRQDFPALSREIEGKQLVYFDSAATTLKPRQVAEAEFKYYTENGANVNRAVHTLSWEATEVHILAHKRCAELVGAESWREIIFTRNATEALNLVAYSLSHSLGPRDVIVSTVMEHHSNLVPWQQVAQRTGAKLKFVDIKDDGTLNIDMLFELVRKPARILAISGASNVTGYVPPLEKILPEVKKINPDILIVVDGAQLVPHKKVDVKKLGCDFLAVSAHKMLGPTGIGFLWGRQEVLESMHPFLFGGDMISKVTLEGAEWNELPFKFEAGTPNIAGSYGVERACRYMQGIYDVLAEHEKELLYAGYELLRKIDKVELYVEPHEGAEWLGIISFNVKDVHPHDVADFLNRYGIAVRSGHHCAQPLMRRLGMENAVRISFHIYNTLDELEYFADVLRRFVKVFS